MPYLNFDQLMGVPNAVDRQQDFEIPGLGTVRIRALSMREYWELQDASREAGEFNNERWQALVLSRGMISPAVSYDEARKLESKPYGFIEPLIRAISGLTMISPTGVIPQEAVDEAEVTFRKEPDQAGNLPASG